MAKSSDKRNRPVLGKGLVVPLSKQAVTRRIRALGLVAERCKSDASTLVGTVLRMWCEAAFPALPEPSLPYSVALITELELVEFVATLNQLPFVEAIYWLSSSYAMLAEESYRRELAMFFTPASLVEGLLDDLAQQGVDFESHHFMDPACGGAAFLTPIALRMRSALKRKGNDPLRILKHIEKNLRGTELDGTLCEMSRHFLCMALHEEIQETGYVPEFRVQQANSLVDLVAILNTVDVVVCNPPYRKMRVDELNSLRNDYAEVIEAQPNLYCLFIALCVRLLRIDGRAALVTPTSFLSGQYFGKLRKFLIQNTDVEHIGMVSDRKGVFIDVEQETALTILRRRIGVEREQAKTNVSVVSGTGQYKSVGKCSLPSSRSVWPIPRSLQDVDILRATALSKFRIADYGYRIRVGAYVWNRDKRPKFETLYEVKREKAHTAMPLLWSRDITSTGVIKIDDVSVGNGKHRFVDMGDKKHSSVITSPCVVMQRVTSNDQPRRLVAATVSQGIFVEYGGFVGENHVVIIEKANDEPVLQPTEMAELLSTHVIDRCFRCISGATNVSIFELSQLALPDPKALREAMERSSSVLEEAVFQAFGLVASDRVNISGQGNAKNKITR